jgi:oligoendopeptidase F
MDYKGYNIAVHEFGHNVEQTYSLHNTSNYLLRGVPNNAFTEAIAFTFQTKDLDILGIKNSSQEAKLNYILDNYWSTFEIMGVATVDQRVWKWLYENPNADKKSLCENTIRIAKEVWNEYYADVIGVKDSPILAVYSHMIDYPLYLTAYPLGHLIEFQLESHYKGKDFAKETKRVSSIGKLTPKLWMLKAVGWEISSESLLSETSKAVKELGK